MPLKRPSKETLEKLRQAVERFIPVLKKSEKAKINEADTRIIVTDILGGIFGYDKYFELTAEQMIRGTYADYAIKLDGEIKAIIEVKAINVALKENHIRQAVNYAANEGVPWAFLTNGRVWKVYKVSVSGKVSAEKFFEFDLLNIDDSNLENLYYLTRESLKKGLLDELWEYRKALDPTKLVSVLLSEPVLKKIKSEFSKITGYKVTEDEISDLLISKVIKPDLLKQLATRAEPESEEEEINLKGLSEHQYKVLKVLAEADKPLTSEEIKQKVGEQFDLGPVMRGLYKRLGRHLVKEGKAYMLDEYGKQLVSSFKGR